MIKLPDKVRASCRFHKTKSILLFTLHGYGYKMYMLYGYSKFQEICFLVHYLTSVAFQVNSFSCLSKKSSHIYRSNSKNYAYARF